MSKQNATNWMMRPRACRGLSLVEVVISLAISAMLLTAVAAAFSASADAIRINDEFFRASQAARVSMNQMLTEVRRAKAISVSASSKKMDMITYDDKDRTYSYNNGSKALKLITNDITTDPDYTMASNVTSYAIDADTMTDAGGITHVVRVSITIEVEVGNNRMRLSGSAAPRRLVSYQ